jgi:hypothetical protein
MRWLRQVWPLCVEQTKICEPYMLTNMILPHRRLVVLLLPVRGLYQEQAAHAQFAKPRQSSSQRRRVLRLQLLPLSRDRCLFKLKLGLAGMLTCIIKVLQPIPPRSGSPSRRNPWSLSHSRRRVSRLPRIVFLPPVCPHARTPGN